MSFNIRGWFPSANDGVNVWENRRDLNIATIRKHAPDLIGFQELQREPHLADYQRELPEYDFFLGLKYNNDEPHCYPTIFWRLDRFELLDSGAFWLSETPEKFSAAWETACIRSAAWVKLRVRATGKLLLLLNTHLDHVSERARVEGAKLILSRIPSLAPNESRAAVIVTGDFNCNPMSAAYRAFLEESFIDTFLMSGNRDDETSFTFHEFTGKPYPKFDRIDWIMLRDAERKLRAVNASIIRDAAPPLFPSDHYPIVADFSLESRAPS
jgi:endonuclease/exonuclease/phosphatase family metal-dependent hydrolase